MEHLRGQLASLFEVPGGGAAPRNAAMEGLRAVAVILVFFVHYHSVLARWIPEEVPTGTLAFALRYVGHAGVDLFFILSGYLIYAATLSKTFTYRGFMQRRLQRIYPTFLAVLLVYLGLSFLVPGESKLPAATSEAIVYVLANLLLLPGVFDLKPMITVAWSLSYELFFYLTLPVVVAVLGLRSHGTRARVILIGALAVAIVCLPLVGLGRYLQVLMFVGGMLVYELRHRVQASMARPVGRLLRTTAAVLALASLPVAYLVFFGAAEGGEPYPFYAFTVRSVWLLFALGGVVSVTLTGEGALARLCSWTPLRWLGNMSYSYYLIHGLVLKAVALFALRLSGLDAAQPVAFWLLMPVAFVLTLVGSAVLYAWVEKPFSLGGELPWAARLRTLVQRNPSAEHAR